MNGENMQEELTACELLVMKVIWESEKVLSIQEITSEINRVYHKAWKTQTVSTFLSRIVKKGYLDMQRKGRVFYYYPQVTEDEYGKREIAKCVDFWSNGKLDSLVASFAEVRELSEEEKQHIRSLLDGMD